MAYHCPFTPHHLLTEQRDSINSIFNFQFSINMHMPFIIDAHLDLSMNALEWNRDLRQPLKEINRREIGMTDKPDMGPFGYTGELLAGDIIDFIEKQDLQEIHVVGHSFGSLITQILAVKIPQRCADYVLIDTAVDCRNNPVILSVRNGDGDGFKGLNHYPDGLPDSFLQEWTAMGNESKSFRAAALEHVRQMPMVSWKNLMDGLLQFNSIAFIGDIHGDVLVLWGTEDDIFPKADQDQVKAGLTGCNVKYVDVDGASHNGFWDSMVMAETYADHILDFIEKK